MKQPYHLQHLETHAQLSKAYERVQARKRALSAQRRSLGAGLPRPFQALLRNPDAVVGLSCILGLALILRWL